MSSLGRNSELLGSITQYPQFNYKAINHILHVSGGLLQEIISLQENLGLNCEPEDLPDLDDLFLRFGEICNHWNWKETPDLQNLNMDPPLKKASSGIYNRAVVILGDQSSFTAGLEAELNSLKRVDESELNKSVLGS